MPNWKKVIVSGSDASLNSLIVNNGVTGSLQGTASWANNVISASFASTAVSASFATNAVSASFAPTATNVFLQGGNSFGAQAVLGTNDVQNLAFETSGSVRMTISSSGNVGVGVSTPAYPLEVNGKIYSSTEVQGGTAFINDTGGISVFGSNTSTRSIRLGRNGTSNDIFITGSSGNVGIGTANPLDLLHVNGNITTGNGSTIKSVSGFLVIQAATNLVLDGASGTVNIRTSSTDKVVILNNGNVGIGTTSPTVPLHVIGNILVTGTSPTFSGGALEIQGTANAVKTFYLNRYGVANGSQHRLRAENGYFEIASANSEPIVLTGGNVGIGTTTPNSRLEVYDASNALVANFNSGQSTYVRIQRAGTSIGDFGSANALVSGGSVNDFTVHARSGSNLVFAYNFGEIARFNTSGNLGIGTSSPAYKLDISGSNTRFRNSGGSFELDILSSAVTSRISSTSTVFALGSLTNHPVIFWTNADEKVRIDTSGNVGIGTTAPTARLHVSASTGVAFEVDGASAATILYITSSGNVGIGTTTPVSTLHVNGVVSIGATSVSTEGSLFLGPRSTGEGGQIFFQAGTSYTSASMIDMYQDAVGPYFRILRGTNTSSDALIAQFNTHTKQFQLPAYTSTSSFAGTATAYLAVDATGSVITVAGSGGASLSGGSTNYVARWASSTTLTTGSLYDDGSKVGIGTTSPTRIFTINGGSSSSRILLQNTSSGFTIGNGFDIVLDNSGNTQVWNYQNGTMQFATNNSERMRIDSGGNVGIGTTIPDQKLVVQGNGAKIKIQTASDPSTYYTSIESNYDSSNSFNIIDGGLYKFGSKALVTYNDTYINSYYNVYIATGTTTNNSASNIRLFVTSEGNVGINTTSPIAKLDVEGNFQLLNANYNSYSSSVSGTTTLATIATSSYNGVFFDFVAFSGSNQRAGTLIGSWRSGTVQYTEYSTPDIGSTAAAVTMSVALSGANALVQSITAPGWAIKATYRTV